MRRKRRNHSPEFISKVALAAIKGDQSLVYYLKTARSTKHLAGRDFSRCENSLTV
jgi:hypothetical protein